VGKRENLFQTGKENRKIFQTARENRFFSRRTRNSGNRLEPAGTIGTLEKHLRNTAIFSVNRGTGGIFSLAVLFFEKSGITVPSITGEKENRGKSFRLLICISIVQQVTSTSACLTGRSLR
jgi:hypothetical protein